MSIAHQYATVYNKDGRLIQVEYAMKAVNLGTTTMGAKVRDGVILISEKKIMCCTQNAQSSKKHYRIYDRIAVGASGISGDAQTIVERCRDLCIKHEATYNENIGIEKLMESVCSLALKFSEKELRKRIFNRPYGVSLLFAAWDEGPRLYNVDPSGSFLGYKAKVIGSTHEILEASLEGEYEEGWDVESGVPRMLRLLRNVMKDEMTGRNVEVTVVTKEGVKMLSVEEIESYL